MTRRQFAHLARADQIDVLALQRSENLLGQFDRDRGHRHRRRTHRGFRAHPLGHGERAGQQQIELRVHRAHGAGRGIGFFHLSQNLRLTHHHRIQARGHAKQVTDRIALAVFVEVRLVVRRDSVESSRAESRAGPPRRFWFAPALPPGCRWRGSCLRPRRDAPPDASSASGSRDSGIARRSRTSTGAVLWFTPMS